MRKVLLISVFLAVITGLFSQNCKLSPEARRYMIQGEEAMKMAKDESDFQMAVDKFERALEYAADCADIYYNLAVVYGLHLSETEGETAFYKAEKYLKAYRGLNPSNASEADDLLAKIELRREKYQKNKIDAEQKQQQEKWDKAKLLEGKWKRQSCFSSNNIWADLVIVANSQGLRIKFIGNAKEYYQEGNLSMNNNGTFSFDIEYTYYHNSGKMGGEYGRNSYDFNSYFKFYGTIELTSDDKLKIIAKEKKIKDVDNRTNETVYPDTNDYYYIIEFSCFYTKED